MHFVVKKMSFKWQTLDCLVELLYAYTKQLLGLEKKEIMPSVMSCMHTTYAQRANTNVNHLTTQQ